MEAGSGVMRGKESSPEATSSGPVTPSIVSDTEAAAAVVIGDNVGGVSAMRADTSVQDNLDSDDSWSVIYSSDDSNSINDNESKLTASSNEERDSNMDVENVNAEDETSLSVQTIKNLSSSVSIVKREQTDQWNASLTIPKLPVESEGKVVQPPIEVRQCQLKNAAVKFSTFMHENLQKAFQSVNYGWTQLQTLKEIPALSQVGISQLSLFGLGVAIAVLYSLTSSSAQRSFIQTYMPEYDFALKPDVTILACDLTKDFAIITRDQESHIANHVFIYGPSYEDNRQTYQKILKIQGRVNDIFMVNDEHTIESNMAFMYPFMADFCFHQPVNYLLFSGTWGGSSFATSNFTTASKHLLKLHKSVSDEFQELTVEAVEKYVGKKTASHFTPTHHELQQILSGELIKKFDTQLNQLFSKVDAQLNVFLKSSLEQISKVEKLCLTAKERIFDESVFGDAVKEGFLRVNDLSDSVVPHLQESVVLLKEKGLGLIERVATIGSNLKVDLEQKYKEVTPILKKWFNNSQRIASGVVSDLKEHLANDVKPFVIRQSKEINYFYKKQMQSLRTNWPILEKKVRSQSSQFLFRSRRLLLRTSLRCQDYSIVLKQWIKDSKNESIHQLSNVKIVLHRDVKPFLKSEVGNLKMASKELLVRSSIMVKRWTNKLTATSVTLLHKSARSAYFYYHSLQRSLDELIN